MNESADLESILSGDILVCERVQDGGAFNMRHPLLKCLLRQKKQLPTRQVANVAQLPMGVIVEIGRTLDVETRKNLMLANKLMIDAFSNEDREETKSEYASYMLAKTWRTLFDTAVTKNYSLNFRFERQNKVVDVIISSDGNKLFITLSINTTHKESLQKALPLAQMKESVNDNKSSIYLDITHDSVHENTRGKDNIATPTTVINALHRLTYGMEMLPPSAFRYTIFSRYARKTTRVKPIFEKLSMYHIQMKQPPQNSAQNFQNAQNVQSTQRIRSAKYLTTSQAIEAARNGTIMQMIHDLHKKINNN